MTGEDHDIDALIAVLRSPALPRELEGEEAAVTAMLGVLSAAPAASTGHRSRRGIAVAAVTVASLGVGGLVAAGPGNLFSPAADRPSITNGPDSTSATPTDDTITDDDGASTITLPPPGPTSSVVARIAEPGTDLTDADGADPSDAEAEADHCEAERHGDAVSEAARATVPGEDVRDTARSDCGKPDRAGPDDDSPSLTAPGLTGETPATTAPGLIGDTPATTAPGLIGDTPGTTAPGLVGDTPATTAPGLGDSPASTAPRQTVIPPDTAPVQTGGNGSDTAPGRVGDNPSDTAPGLAPASDRP